MKLWSRSRSIVATTLIALFLFASSAHAWDESTIQLPLTFDHESADKTVVVDPLLTSSSWDSTESDTTIDVAWGDWDGDGDLDLAVANANEPNRVYENTGGVLGTSAVWSSDESDNSAGVAWGDWDGDGDLDLAVGNAGDPNRVYENTGTSLATSPIWSSSESDLSVLVAWGDWDGDGDLDLAVGNGSEPNRVYENTGGALSSSAVWSSSESDLTYEVAWGDLDGDGDLDLAAGNEGNPNRVYENTGGTLSSAAVWSSSESDATRSIAWGDWDGDGEFELAAGNYGAPNRVYENTGATLSTGAVWSSTESDTTYEVAWGDWDGDGDLDLASGNVLSPNRVHENTTGTILDLSAAWSSTESDFTASVAWGDWDGDGDLDLAAGNAGEPNRVYDNPGPALDDVAVWASDETESTTDAAWGDWDGDGDLDLAVATDKGVNRVYENVDGILDTSAAWTSAVLDKSFGLAWGDWDGDGDLDLAVASDGQSNRVYENLGGVLDTESAWISFETDDSRDVAWGDWDGDGDLDLAVANRIGPNRVYENVGGTLTNTAVWSSSESDSTRGIAWGDWDGDGDLDLAAANFDQPDQVYRNQGGSLATSAIWSSSDASGSSSVAWGDWDGDGDLDLAVDGGEDPARVYENLGGVLDTTAVWSSSGSSFSLGVAWGDWDGDGDLDLAVAAVPNQEVYENVGGTLATTPVWSSSDPSNAQSVAWGDMDGDGDLDLAVGNGGSANQVYRNGSIARAMRLPETAVGPVASRRPGLTDAAAAFSSECLSSPYPVLDYALVDEESDPARRVRFEYSTAGEQWLPATPVSGSLEEVSAGPSGHLHQLAWDNLSDGVLRAPLVRLRATVPYQASTRLAGPIQRAAMRAVSPPFALCTPAADLSVTLDGDGASTTATPGGTVLYDLQAKNNGLDDVEGVLVSVDFPAELSDVTWTCNGFNGGVCASPSGSGAIEESVDLGDEGGRVEFTIEADVDSGATGTMATTAGVTLPPGLGNLSPDDDSVTLIDVLLPSTDLSVSISDGQATAVPGLPVPYEVTVTNAGPSDALGAQVVSVFPPALTGVIWNCLGVGAGTCEGFGSGDIDERVDLPVGSSVIFFIAGTVDPGATGSLVTSATVLATLPTPVVDPAPKGATGGDPDSSNNNAVDVKLLTPEADLAITKDDGTGVAVLGETVTYTIEVTNPGPSSVVGATVEDVFPVDLLGVSWTCAGAAGGTCTASGSGDLADSADLPAGTSVTYTATANVDETSVSPEISNTATVASPSGVTELNAADNTSTDVDTVLPPEIFDDGFESGDASAWSSMVP